MEPRPNNIKTKALVATLAILTSEVPIPTEKDFLDLADNLEENGAEGLDKNAISIVTTILRGEDPLGLG